MAKSFEEQNLMIKILSNNLEAFENFIRMEIIVHLKKAYTKLLKEIKIFLKEILNWDEEKLEKFIYQFLPYWFGIYVYTNVIKKQK